MSLKKSLKNGRADYSVTKLQCRRCSIACELTDSYCKHCGAKDPSWHPHYWGYVKHFAVLTFSSLVLGLPFYLLFGFLNEYLFVPPDISDEKIIQAKLTNANKVRKELEAALKAAPGDKVITAKLVDAKKVQAELESVLKAPPTWGVAMKVNFVVCGCPSFFMVLFGICFPISPIIATIFYIYDDNYGKPKEGR
jgi:hypothetical protein